MIYVNDMPQAVTSTLLLYADNSRILYQHKNVLQIEKQLNEDFENLCDWFVDNKPSIHFGEEKTKSILFASKRRAKNICQLNIKYKDKYKTTFGSNISWVRARQNDVRRANGIKSYQ